jgi:hypothetical protein
VLEWLNDPPAQCSEQVASMPVGRKSAAEQSSPSNPSTDSKGSIHSMAEQRRYQQHQQWMKCQMRSLDCRHKRRMESVSTEKEDSTGSEHRHSNQLLDNRSKDHHTGRHKVSRNQEHESME